MTVYSILGNITKVFVAFALDDPLFDAIQATRFLITAESTGVDIFILLTKSDLLLPCDLQSQLPRIDKWGYKVMAISTKTGKGISEFRKHLQNSALSVLCGPSGVGKTSLLNILLPDLNLKVSDISFRLRRGKNTTRNVELYKIGENSYLADTPGFNRPDITCEPTKLAYFFPELREQNKFRGCKFRNCLHRQEPGCILDKEFERYDIYKEIVQELI